MNRKPMIEQAYLAFVANFVVQLHDRDVSREQAILLVPLAAATLLGAVFHVLSDEFDEKFAAKTIITAIDRYYGRKEV